MFVSNPKARKAVYAVLAALGAGAVAYGVIDQSTANMLVSAIGVLLMGQSALAGGNVSQAPQVPSLPQVDVPATVEYVRDLAIDAAGEAQAQVDAARAELERRIGLGR